MYPVGNLTVQYDRPSEKWQVNNGHLIAAFSDRASATRMAIAVQNRPLYDLVKGSAEKWPQLNQRLWKAAEIVLAGGLLPPREGEWCRDEVARVKSQRRPEDAYSIRDYGDSEHGLSCDCQDWRDAITAEDVTTSHKPKSFAPRGPGGFIYCKHILAYHLKLRLEKQTTPQPPAQVPPPPVQPQPPAETKEEREFRLAQFRNNKNLRREVMRQGMERTQVQPPGRRARYSIDLNPVDAAGNPTGF